MKRFINIFLACCMALTLASCIVDNTPPQPLMETETLSPIQTQGLTPTVSPSEETISQGTVKPDVHESVFEGKIAIVSNTIAGNVEEYLSAQEIVRKYGENKIVHVAWPDKYMEEPDQMISIVGKLGADPDIKVIIVNQAIPGTNAAFDKLVEIRKDIFVIYCEPTFWESEYVLQTASDFTQTADLLLKTDELAMGSAMAKQAKKLGAKTFIHYSFPRHMSQPILSGRRDRIMEECEKLGIQFVDETAPDPQDEIGMDGAHQFILEDFPKMITEYGKDTAFFSTSCGLQIPLIKEVVDGGCIYPQPCDPSPYHGFPAALGLDQPDLAKNGAVGKLVELVRQVITEKNALGRLSTWPVSAAFLLTNASAEYAVKWINGEVPKEGVDVEVLKQLMEEYAGVEVAIITDPQYAYTSWDTALPVISKYGEDKVIFVAWPDYLIAQQDEMINIVTTLGKDLEI